MAIRKRKFVPKHQVVEAVQFTGKNSKELAEFIRKLGYEARARGVFVEFTAILRRTLVEEKLRIRKGDWFVWTTIEVDGEDRIITKIYNNFDFKEEFEPKKPVISTKKAQDTLKHTIESEKPIRRRKGSPQPKPAEQHVGN